MREPYAKSFRANQKHFMFSDRLLAIAVRTSFCAVTANGTAWAEEVERERGGGGGRGMEKEEREWSTETAKQSG